MWYSSALAGFPAARSSDEGRGNAGGGRERGKGADGREGAARLDGRRPANALLLPLDSHPGAAR